MEISRIHKDRRYKKSKCLSRIMSKYAPTVQSGKTIWEISD